MRSEDASIFGQVMISYPGRKVPATPDTNNNATRESTFDDHSRTWQAFQILLRQARYQYFRLNYMQQANINLLFV
jgi:hypothetical protein